MDEHPLGSGIPGSFEGLLRRLGRQPYYPQWGDDKDRQATSSASRRLFGEDRTGQIFSEIGHESGRTGSPHREPQPYLHARAKAWWKMARRTKGIDPAAVRRLKAHVEKSVVAEGASLAPPPLPAWRVVTGFPRGPDCHRCGGRSRRYEMERRLTSGKGHSSTAPPGRLVFRNPG